MNALVYARTLRFQRLHHAHRGIGMLAGILSGRTATAVRLQHFKRTR